MNTMFIFVMIVPLVVGLLLAINFILAPHRPYKEKKTFFECGLVSFLLQNRKQVGIAFFLFGILYLAFDLEITLLYPFTVSFYLVSIFGLVIYLVFNYLLGFAFVFEYGRGALVIELKKLKEAKVSTIVLTNQKFTTLDSKN